MRILLIICILAIFSCDTANRTNASNACINLGAVPYFDKEGIMIKCETPTKECK